MGMLWHLTLAADGRRTLFRDEASLRKAVRVLASTTGQQTLLFCIVDDHVHDVVCCDRMEAGRLAQSLNLALRPVSEVPFSRGADVRPVESRQHLIRLVDYVLTQPPHHGLAVHPALWTGSCFQDLIGARVVGALGQPLSSFLPRSRQVDLMAAVGLGPVSVTAADDATVRAAGSVRLAAAACSALAVGPSPVGNSVETVRMRTASAIIAARASIATRETASALDLTMRAIQRLALSAPDEQVLLAIRRRLALEDAVALRGTTERETRTGS